VPDSVPQLEDAVQTHQTLMDKMAQAYTDVCADGKALLDMLQTPVSASSFNAITATADFSDAATHVLDLVHEVFAHHRDLCLMWHQGKVKLHKRLSLRLFEQDVRQVIDWLDNHGDAFLKKNVIVGKTFQKAQLLRKSHHQFELVAQVG
jgi:hypothetical protein